MPENFDAQAREELQKLLEWRQKLRRDLAATNNKIHGLQLFLGEEQAGSPKATSARRAASDRPFTPRGRKMKMILSVLKEIHPHGLGVHEIVERAATQGVELIPASTRSQLSRLKSEGMITSRDGAYSYVSPRQPEATGPDLLEQVGPNDTGASAETETPEQEVGLAGLPERSLQGTPGRFDSD